MAVILANAFSPTMLPLAEGEAEEICVEKLGLEKARRLAEKVDYCAIGHESTARLAKELLGVSVKCERKFVVLSPGSTLLVITLAFRPPEGKVYSYQELLELLETGKIVFYGVHYGPC